MMSSPNRFSQILDQLGPDVVELVQHGLTRFSNQLRSVGLIPEQEHSFALTALGVSCYDKASRLISCVRSAVQSSPTSEETFWKFVEILKSDQYYCEVTNELILKAEIFDEPDGKVIKNPELDLFQLCCEGLDKTTIRGCPSILMSLTVVNPNTHDLYGNSPLWLASFHGNYRVVYFLLVLPEDSARPDIQNQNAWRDTALIAASVKGFHRVAAELLVEESQTEALRVTAIDYQNKYGHHSLYGASFKGHEKVVKLLLKHRAQVDLPTNDDLGLTALHAAIQEGHLRVADTLIKKGAKVDHQDKYGQHPLWKASFDGDEGAVELLLAKKADVNQTTNDEYGSTALEIACQKGHTKIAEMLLKKGATTDYRNKKGQHSLYKASYYGHVQIVKLLLDYKADVNLPTTDDLGSTALVVSCENGHTDVVLLLLEHGATTDYHNKVHASSLFMASQEGNLEVVGLLLKYGATVDLPAENGSTPLTVASEFAKEEVAKCLIEHGARVNHQQMNGWAALHFASKYGHKKIVILLIQYGARVDLLTDTGRTALDVARDQSHNSVCELLEECDASGSVNPGEMKEQQGIQEKRQDLVKKSYQRLLRIFDILEDSLLPGRKEKRECQKKKETPSNIAEANQQMYEALNT